MSDFRPDIWRLQASFDTKGLIEALKNADAGIRKRAAAALRALGAIEAIPALKAALDKEQDTDTRSNIVAALAALEIEKERGEDDTTELAQVSEVDELIKQLNHPQPEKVIAAALKLGEMRDKRAVEPLVMLFNNGKIDIKVRLTIAEALLKLESAPVEVALLGALRSANWKVRRNGAAILGQLKAEWATEPLAKALTDENDTVRKTARAALKHMNTPEARAALGILDKTGEKTTPNRQTGLLKRMTEAGITPPSVPAQKAADADAPTQLKSPFKPAWPKPPPIDPEEDPSKIPTRPLNPERLKEAEERLNGSKKPDES